LKKGTIAKFGNVAGWSLELNDAPSAAIRGKTEGKRPIGRMKKKREAPVESNMVKWQIGKRRLTHHF